MERSEPVKVFVSYSHNPDDTADRRDHLRTLHRAHALALADYLVRRGIDCRIDQYREDDPPDNWPQWMERQIEDCDYVLMVCTPSYFHYVTTTQGGENGGPEKGLGSRFEGRIIYGYLSKNPASSKFIPIFFGSRQSEYIPSVVAQSASYQILFPLDMKMPEQCDLRRLYEKLTGQAAQVTAEPIQPQAAKRRKRRKRRTCGKKRKLEDKENAGPVISQPKGSIDWCCGLKDEDLNLGDKVQLIGKDVKKSIGSAVFSFEHKENVDMVRGPKKVYFVYRLLETTKLKEVHGVAMLTSVKAKGIIEITSTEATVAEPVSVFCFLGCAKTDRQKMNYDHSQALATKTISSKNSTLEFSFEQTLESGESCLKLMFKKEGNETEKIFKGFWKCSVKNLKTWVTAKVEKK